MARPELLDYQQLRGRNYPADGVRRFGYNHGMPVRPNAANATLAFILFFVSAAAAMAGQPSMLTAESCLKKLPSEKRATENYREYYRKFSEMICSGDVAQDKAWQSCVLQGMSSGHYSADNISDAYNECNPTIHACTLEMNALAKPRTQQQREFYRNFCKASAEATKTEKSCFVDFTRRDPTYLDHPESLYVLCIDEAQECVQDFLTHGAFKKTHEFLDGIASVCHRPMVDIDVDWRACMREAFDSGRFLNETSLAWRACDPKVRASKDCVFNTLVAPRFTALMKDRGTSDRVDTASAICSMSNEEARNCLLEGLGKDLRVADASVVCKFASSDTRACLTDYFLRRGDFGGGSAQASKMPVESAQEVCKISNRTDRKCVLDTALERARGGDVGGQVLGATLLCAEKSKERRACAAIVTTRLNALGMKGDIRREESFASQICEIPNFEMRACVLDKVPNVLKERAFMSEIIATCQTAFMGYLFSPLESVGAGKNCGFNRD